MGGNSSSLWKKFKRKLKQSGDSSKPEEPKTQRKWTFKKTQEQIIPTTNIPKSSEARPAAAPLTEEQLAAERERQHRQRAAHEQRMQLWAEWEEKERQKEAKAKREEQKRRLRKTADMYERAGLTEGSSEDPSKSRLGAPLDYEKEDSVVAKVGRPRKVVPVRRVEGENWSKYERETGMVDPHILRWD